MGCSTATGQYDRSQRNAKRIRLLNELARAINITPCTQRGMILTLMNNIRFFTSRADRVSYLVQILISSGLVFANSEPMNWNAKDTV